MKYLSTFSGIGGFEVGLHSVMPDAQCIGYSEVDSHAIKTYEEHYEHHNYGDITAIDAAALPDFDLIVGGFPCQAFSVAGKRKGFDETRGTLFFDLARLLKHKRPGHFVFENVKGLLSHDGGKTIQTIAGVLSDLGYRVEWQVLNSKDFGVPQNRERIYIVGHLRERCARQILPIVQGGSWDSETQGESQSQGQRVRGDDTRVVAATLAVRDYKGGNNLINQLNQPRHSNDRVYGHDGISPTLNTMQGGNRQPFVAMTETRTEEAKAIRREHQKQGRDFSPRRGKVLVPRKDEIGNTVTSNLSKEHYLTDNVRIRRLTPTECERLQGFPDGWTKYWSKPYTDEKGILRYKIVEQSDTQRYKQCGNAVTTNVVEAVMRKLKECLI